MDNRIHVESVLALPHLYDALGKFSADLLEKIRNAERIVNNYLNEMAERCRRLENECRSCENEYDSADSEEDDMEYLAYQCRKAREKLNRAMRIQRDAVEASQNLARSINRVNEVAGERLENARDFIKQKIEELNSYLALQVDSDSYNSRPSLSVTSDNGNNGANGTSILNLSKNSMAEISRIKLPEGFAWIDLDKLSEREIVELPTLKDFGGKGVTYEDMKDGLCALERDILPVLRNSAGNISADIFEARSYKDHAGSDRPVKKIFNVFFGTQVNHEPIHIDYSVPDALYTLIQNGRHRIKVARDLGWKAIPGQVKEYDWSNK